MCLALACVSGPLTAVQSMASSTMPWAPCAMALLTSPAYVLGCRLPSSSVMFQPSVLPASIAASLGILLDSAT